MHIVQSVLQEGNNVKPENLWHEIFRGLLKMAIFTARNFQKLQPFSFCAIGMQSINISCMWKVSGFKSIYLKPLYYTCKYV